MTATLWVPNRLPSFSYDGGPVRTYAIEDDAANMVVRLARESERVACDIETNGLAEESYEVKVIIIGTAEHACVLDAYNPKHVQAARDALAAAREIVFHNCFAGPTQFLTRQGLRTLESCAGQRVEVWTGERWQWATINAFGDASVSRVEFGWTKSRSSIRETFDATANHRWLLRDGRVVTTAELKPGDVVPAAVPDIPFDESSEAFRHGLMFADGSMTRIRQHDGKFSHQIRLCGWKSQYAHLFDSVTYPATYSGDAMCYHHSDTNYKELPSTDDPEYLASFIAGWFMFDGDKQTRKNAHTNSCGISSVHLDHLEWLREVGPSAGYLVTGINSQYKSGKSGGFKSHWIHTATVTRSAENRWWTVKSIQRDVARVPVFCPEVDGDVDRFTLAPGILTMNSPFDVPPLVASGAMALDDVWKVVDTLIWANMAITDGLAGRGLRDLEELLFSASTGAGQKDRFKDWCKINRMSVSEGFKRATYQDRAYVMYAGYDAVITARLYAPLLEMVIQQFTNHPFGRFGADRTLAEELAWEAQIVNRMMLRRTARGLTVDPDGLDREMTRLFDTLSELQHELTEHGVESATKPADLVKVLDAAGAIPEDYPRTEKTKRPSTAGKDLKKLSHPAAAAYLKYGDTNRLFNYMNAAKTISDRTDGRLHPIVAIMKAVTGRSSYGLPALQQFTIPAREMIMADAGCTLTSIDFSQIEPVIGANLARDLVPLEVYEHSGDLYTPIAQMAGVSRTVAKVILLAAMYGQGILKLAAGLSNALERVVSMAEAKELQERVSAAMPLTWNFIGWCTEWSRVTGKTWTIGGRIVDVHPDFAYKGPNYTIQGSGWDLLSNTIVEMFNRGMYDELYLSFHDELIVSEAVAIEVMDIMSTPPARLVDLVGRTPTLRVDRADLGSRWRTAPKAGCVTCGSEKSLRYMENSSNDWRCLDHQEKILV